MPHANIEFLHRLDDAFNQGDFETVLAAFADDCLIHVSGTSKFAGDHAGKDAFAGVMMEYVESLGEDPQTESHAILADDDHGVMLQKATATKGGQTIVIDTVNVFHIAGGKITEMWTLDYNQHQADAFYDS